MIKEMNLPKDKKLTGLIALTSKAVGFVTIPGIAEDILIEPSDLNTALHGDEVEIVLHPRSDEDDRLTGEVARIIRRAKTDFVGTVDKRKKGAVAFIKPDDTKVYIDFLLPAMQSMRLQNGYKVQVRLKRWFDPKKSPEVALIKILGRKGDNNVEMESIVLEKGFAVGFPDKVEKEAELIAKHSSDGKGKSIHQKELAGRKDFRRITTFTIDPADAKDFDDAISIKKLPNNLYEIGVHIADVSHYVKEGGPLDKEARHRGVSIYLVDRTIPMLPEVLSNDLCSLNPNEDKLTYSAVMTMDLSGNIQKVWLGRTVINSDKRFTYEEAQKILEMKNGKFYEELDTLNTIAKVFRGHRRSAGALDFEKEEVKFVLDKSGKPLGIQKKERQDAHKLIEEFMILANREVAAYLSKEIKRIKKGASVYRVHATPKKEAIGELLFLLKALGHDVSMAGPHISSKELAAVLEQLKDRPEEPLIKTLALRAMAKAVYSTENIGHYGLALENYTHFTSPIRRYADILVHRILTTHLKGKSLSKQDIHWYQSTAIALSAREIEAAEAERASVAYKQTEYMLEKQKKTPSGIYSGIISGITKWGVYVEESETKSQGMIRFKDMRDDFYVFEKESYSIVGSKNKKRYTLGDKVKFRVLGGDLAAKTLDFQLI